MLLLGKLADFFEELRLQANGNHLLNRPRCNLGAAVLDVGDASLRGLAASLFVLSMITPLRPSSSSRA